MDAVLNLVLLSGDQLVRAGAFAVILYFVVMLYRARMDGSRPLLIGCIAILVGEGFRFIAFTGIAARVSWIPSILVTSIGFCLAAYGFAKVVRWAIKRR